MNRLSFIRRIFDRRRIGCVEHKNWSEAAEGGRYDLAELARLVAFKTRYYRDNHKGDLTPTELQTIAAVGAAAVLTGKSELRVLDFGGGAGIHYFQAQRALPELKLDWRIVETETMIKAAEPVPGLSFYNDISEAAETGIDLVHTSCSLGFVEDTYGCLRKLLALNAKAVLVARMALAPEHELTLQHRHYLSWNGRGQVLPDGFTDRLIAYPMRVPAKEEFEAVLLENYSIRWHLRDATAEVKVPRRKLEGHTYFITRG